MSPKADSSHSSVLLGCSDYPGLPRRRRGPPGDWHPSSTVLPLPPTSQSLPRTAGSPAPPQPQQTDPGLYSRWGRSSEPPEGAFAAIRRLQTASRAGPPLLEGSVQSKPGLPEGKGGLRPFLGCPAAAPPSPCEQRSDLRFSVSPYWLPLPIFLQS